MLYSDSLHSTNQSIFYSNSESMSFIQISIDTLMELVYLYSVNYVRIVNNLYI